MTRTSQRQNRFCARVSSSAAMAFCCVSIIAKKRDRVQENFTPTDLAFVLHRHCTFEYDPVLSSLADSASRSPVGHADRQYLRTKPAGSVRPGVIAAVAIEVFDLRRSMATCQGPLCRDW